MRHRPIDAVAIGSCYVDTNVMDFPFGHDGIANETELIGEQYETVLGGSAVNFCRFLGDLGLQTSFVGMAGQDANGDTLERLLRVENIQSNLVRRADLLTNIGFNVTNADGNHIMLVAGTANAALSPEATLPALQKVLPDSRALYLGGCFKLKSFVSAFDDIATLADQHEVALVVDHGRVPKDTSEEMLEAVRGLVRRSMYYLPSHEEFCAVWGTETIEQGLQKLAQDAPGVTVIVKDGPRGAFYWSDASMHQIAAQKVDAITNVTGAGDSFNAGVMAALAKGLPLHAAIEYGTKVAAAKVQSNTLPPL